MSWLWWRGVWGDFLRLCLAPGAQILQHLLGGIWLAVSVVKRYEVNKRDTKASQGGLPHELCALSEVFVAHRHPLSPPAWAVREVKSACHHRASTCHHPRLLQPTSLHGWAAFGRLGGAGSAPLALFPSLPEVRPLVKPQMA